MKYVIIIAVIAVVITVVVLAFTPNSKNQTSNTRKYQDIEQKAISLYLKNKKANINFTSGPCLGTVDGYAVDIAHSPRQAIDDLPKNQCPNYVNGKVTHFVELTEGGSIIRVK